MGNLILFARGKKKRWLGYLLSHVGPTCGCKKTAQPTLHVELVTEARGLQAEYATTMQVLQAPHAVCTFWPKSDKFEAVIILISFCIGAPQLLYTGVGFWKSWP